MIKKINKKKNSGIGHGKKGGRESKITRKRRIERVGVNRRRRERRFLSFKDVWRILRRVNSHTEQSAKTKCHGDRVLFLRLLVHSHTDTYFYHTHSCHPLKEYRLSFPLLFSYSEPLTFPLNDHPLNIEQLSVPAGGNIVPLLVS